MRGLAFIRPLAAGAALSVSLGCSKGPETPPMPTPEQMAASQRTRGPKKRSIQEIGKDGFGDRLKEVKSEKGTVSYTFAPKLDGDPQQNFNRMLAAAMFAAPTTFQQEKSAQIVRLTAVHESDAGRKLLVYSIGRRVSDGVDWAHGASPQSIARIANIEHVDPEFKSFTAGRQ